MNHLKKWTCVLLSLAVFSASFAEGEDDEFLALVREKGLYSAENEDFNNAVTRLGEINFRSPEWAIFHEPLLEILENYITNTKFPSERRNATLNLFLMKDGNFLPVKSYLISQLNEARENSADPNLLFSICRFYANQDKDVLKSLGKHIQPGSSYFWPALSTYLDIEAPPDGLVTPELIEYVASQVLEEKGKSYPYTMASLLPRLIATYGKVPVSERKKLSPNVHAAVVLAAHLEGNTVFINIEPTLGVLLGIGTHDYTDILIRLARVETELNTPAATYPAYPQTPNYEFVRQRRRGRPQRVVKGQLLPAPTFFIRGWFEPKDTHGVNCAKLLQDLLEGEGMYRFQTMRGTF